MSYLLQFDGASEPNPGPSGSAYVIFGPMYEEEESGDFVRDVVVEGYSYIEYATNNQAEYTALILGLQKALELGIQNLEIEGDSNLVVNQVSGLWKVKDLKIGVLCDKAKLLYSKFPKKSIKHIPRKENADADMLSKEAIQTKMNIVR
jgi:ribonuclease HI